MNNERQKQYDRVKECYKCDGLNSEGTCKMYEPIDSDYCGYKSTIDNDLEKIKLKRQGVKNILLTFDDLEQIIDEE